MPEWKKTIFVNAIRARMNEEIKTAEEIIKEYIKLSSLEQNEILELI